MIRRFIIEVEVPEDMKVSAILEYLRTAARCWMGALDLEDPIREIETKSVKSAVHYFHRPRGFRRKQTRGLFKTPDDPRSRKV